MIKAWLKKRKEKAEARKQLKQYKEYYKVVRSGLLFIKFIQEDIADQKRNKINRHQRRRFEKELSKKGKLTEEIVQHYKMKIEGTLQYIEMQLNPPKKPKLPKIKAVEAPNMKQPKDK